MSKETVQMWGDLVVATVHVQLFTPNYFQTVKKDQRLLRKNAEKKAKWRAEVKKGQEAAVGKSHHDFEEI